MSDQFEKIQAELWQALVDAASTMPIDPALKTEHTNLVIAGHGDALLAAIVSKIEPDLAEPGTGAAGPGATEETEQLARELLEHLSVLVDIDDKLAVLDRLESTFAAQSDS